MPDKKLLQIQSNVQHKGSIKGQSICPEGHKKSKSEQGLEMVPVSLLKKGYNIKDDSTKFCTNHHNHNELTYFVINNLRNNLHFLDIMQSSSNFWERGLWETQQQRSINHTMCGSCLSYCNLT